MPRIVRIALCIIIANSLLFLSSCDKLFNKNNVPSCSIISPLDNQQITSGEVVAIMVEASDDDGSITEVQFIIDEIEVYISNTQPYTYNWNTTGLAPGDHTIKAMCYDDDNASDSDEITIEIITSQNLNYGSFVDPRDNKSYTTIEIGSQIWMEENLNYLMENSWCHGDNPANGDIYGRLYTWEAAMIACPSGWHLPSDDEWKQMELYMGMSQTNVDAMGLRGDGFGTMLKSTSGWLENGNGTNNYGFNAKPGGFRYVNGDWDFTGYTAHWWTSTVYDNDESYSRNVFYLNSEIERDFDHILGGYSVRCVKD